MNKSANQFSEFEIFECGLLSKNRLKTKKRRDIFKNFHTEKSNLKNWNPVIAAKQKITLKYIWVNFDERENGKRKVFF